MKNRYGSASRQVSRATRLGSRDLETGADNSSEENILPLEGAKTAEGNIVKSTTYEVNYEKTKDSKLGGTSNAWNSPKPEPGTNWTSPVKQ
jgi:hypothetical protein